MRPHEDALTKVAKELDRLLDLDIPSDIREKLWTLISDVRDERRKKDCERDDPPAEKRTV